MSLKDIKRVIEEKEVDDIYKLADTLNNEGFPAFKRKDIDRLKEILYIGTTGNTFYTKQSRNLNNKIDDLKQLIESVDPDLSAQLIKNARNEGFFRHIPIIALIFLKQKSPQHFRQIFNEVVLTGQDLGDYLDLSQSLNILWGASAKKAIHKWLEEKANSFYVLKYRKQICDAIAVSRPKVDNFSNAELLKYAYLLKRKKQSLSITNKQLKHAIDFQESIKKGNIDNALYHAMQGRLPSDLMISLVGSSNEQKIWEVIAENMGVMQFLKYLNKLDSILSNDTLLLMLEKKVTLETLKKAKVFPYRVFIAYQNALTSTVKNYLAYLIEKYIKVYDFGKWKNHDIAILPDISGSMTMKNSKRTIVPTVISGYFSSVMAKGLNINEIYLWDTKCYPLKIDQYGLFDIYNKIYKSNGGGTSMGIGIDYLIKQNIKKDIVILITDSEHWYGGIETSFMKTWKRYKKEINKNAKCVVLEVVGYGNSQVEENFAQKYSVYTVYGWSDSVFKWIEMKVL